MCMCCASLTGFRPHSAQRRNMVRNLFYIAGFPICAATAQAETVTQKMLMEPVVAAANAQCGAERQKVRLTPGPHTNQDVLQTVLDIP